MTDQSDRFRIEESFSCKPRRLCPRLNVLRARGPQSGWTGRISEKAISSIWFRGPCPHHFETVHFNPQRDLFSLSADLTVPLSVPRVTLEIPIRLYKIYKIVIEG